MAVKPEGVDHLEATGAMVSLTAWQGVFEHGQVAAGQRVLAHEGAQVS